MVEGGVVHPDAELLGDPCLQLKVGTEAFRLGQFGSYQRLLFRAEFPPGPRARLDL